MKLTNQEAIEQLKLNNPFMAGKEKELFSQAIDKGIEALENQKTGHWIIHKLEPNGYDHIKCSVCGQFWSVSDHYKIFKYCFNCGAKMEGDKK